MSAMPPSQLRRDMNGDVLMSPEGRNSIALRRVAMDELQEMF
jgi:hypothetical protein